MTQAPDLQAIKDDIRQLIVSVSNLKTLSKEDIADTQLLFDGSLGLDSIDLLELVIALQRKFGIKLRNDASGQEALRSVSSLASAVHGHVHDAPIGEAVTERPKANTQSGDDGQTPVCDQTPA